MKVGQCQHHLTGQLTQASTPSLTIIVIRLMTKLEDEDVEDEEEMRRRWGRMLEVGQGDDGC